MSRTLNLIDILLTTGRHLFLMGRYTEALQPLTRLCEFRKLPRHVLEDFVTAELELDGRSAIPRNKKLFRRRAAKKYEQIVDVPYWATVEKRFGARQH